MESGRIVGETDYRGKPRVFSVNNDPSMTVQSDAHLADINEIMKSFAATGLEALNEADLMFRDVSEFTDLRDALDQAREAEVEFMKLPSKVREIFEHDVAVWLDTAHDEEKRDALVEAGFVKRAEVDVTIGGAGTEDPKPADKLAASDGGEGAAKPAA